MSQLSSIFPDYLPSYRLGKKYFLVGVGLGEVVEGAGGGGNLIPNVSSQILCLSFASIPFPKGKSK